ncbi:MAG: SCP2 sterol-binding domain-containing protein [Vulcanimicrobiota bacterium]
MDLKKHPTVLAYRTRPQEPISARELRQLCLEAGADDAGFVSLERPELDAEREEILRIFPATRSLICLLCRMSVEPVRSQARNAANQEFHSTGDEVNLVARRVVQRLAARGIRAMNPPMAFPMEMDRFPGKVWSISLKPLAVAAGLGRIGIHRNLIHPRFGNFVLIGCVLLAQELDQEGQVLDYNPCLECKLCVAACPVGAISPDGRFDFGSCYTHNYREFMGGFTDWVEQVADSGSAIGYRQRVDDSESASMWQSLSYGANYKAAYCLAVCPAGEEVIAPFLQDRSNFLKEIVKPLQQKVETVYVRRDSDAEAYVQKRFPHKKIKRVQSGLRPTSVANFLAALPHLFQPGQAGQLRARYHFRFSGAESGNYTIVIANSQVEVATGLQARAEMQVDVDSQAWIKFVRKEWGLARLLLTGKLRLKGHPRWLVAFGRCFPS